MVGSDDNQGVLAVGQVESFSHSLLESQAVLEGQFGESVMVTVVNSCTWAEKVGMVYVQLLFSKRINLNWMQGYRSVDAGRMVEVCILATTSTCLIMHTNFCSSIYLVYVMYVLRSWYNYVCCRVSYTSFLKQSTSEPIRRKFDEVKVKEDEAWERS
jgi:hypothetical protein